MRSIIYANDLPQQYTGLCYVTLMTPVASSLMTVTLRGLLWLAPIATRADGESAMGN